MLSETVYSPASRDIVFEEFDGDLVALDLSTGRYFGFNTTARAVWSALVAGASPAEIERHTKFNNGFDSAALSAFIEKLVSVGLLAQDEGRKSGELDAEAAADVAAQDAAPTIEAYDDLADLIVADPIHDTDEGAGWPHVRPAAE